MLNMYMQIQMFKRTCKFRRLMCECSICACKFRPLMGECLRVCTCQCSHMIDECSIHVYTYNIRRLMGECLIQTFDDIAHYECANSDV